MTFKIVKEEDGSLTHGGIRTWKHYGYGCVSGCTKPGFVSGVASGLFTYTVPYDGIGVTNSTYPVPNEIDIEFESRYSRKVHFNYCTFLHESSFNQEILTRSGQSKSRIGIATGQLMKRKLILTLIGAKASTSAASINDKN